MLKRDTDTERDRGDTERDINRDRKRKIQLR